MTTAPEEAARALVAAGMQWRPGLVLVRPPRKPGHGTHHLHIVASFTDGRVSVSGDYNESRVRPEDLLDEGWRLDIEHPATFGVLYWRLMELDPGFDILHWPGPGVGPERWTDGRQALVSRGKSGHYERNGCTFTALALALTAALRKVPEARHG